jgi:putative membrane protein
MLYTHILTTDTDIVWHFYPSVIIGCLALLGIYFAAAFPLRKRFRGSEPVSTGRMLAFTGGVLAIFFALVSPLDDLGDTYLFSAHMIQHLMLTLLAAPLLILGTPGWMLRPLLDHRFIRPVFRTLVSPIPAFLTFNLVYIGWHLPAFYQAALENENIHILQQFGPFLIVAEQYSD